MNVNSLQAPSSATRLAEGVRLIRAIRPAGEGSGLHTHDYHSIIVLLSSPGRSRWRYGEKWRSVRPAAGDVFFCPANVSTAVRAEKAYESILLCLSPNIFTSINARSSKVLLGDVAPAIMRKDTFIQQVVTSLADEVVQAVKAEGELFASSLAFALGVHLSREYTNGSQSHKPAARLSDEELARLDQFIARKLDTQITLEKLASLVKRSRFHFSRLFKASTGMTPHQYVTRYRVQRAKALFERGSSHRSSGVGSWLR